MNRARLSADAAARTEPVRAFVSPSPARRVWQRFRQQRLGYWSLIVFVVAFAASLAGPLWSNDKPLVVRYEGQLYFPMFKTYAETTFGGDFPTPADYLDPYISSVSHAGQLRGVSAEPLLLRHAELLLEGAEPGAAVARKLARHRRPRPRSVRAAAVRLSRVGGVRAGADR